MWLNDDWFPPGNLTNHLSLGPISHYVRPIHSQWHGVARRHLDHLDYLDRIDRGQSSCSRTLTVTLGRPYGKHTCYTSSGHDGVKLGVPFDEQRKSFKPSGYILIVRISYKWFPIGFSEVEASRRRFRQSWDASRKFPPSESSINLIRFDCDWSAFIILEYVRK